MQRGLGARARPRIAAGVIVLGLLMLSTSMVSVADAKTRLGPAGIAFYTPPKPLPGKGHGGLIWARPLTDSAAQPGAANTLLLYRSIGIDGHAVAVSGTLSVPQGQPPRGGWPVITYDHATTGIADVCAPSLDTPSDPAHLLIAYAYPLLDSWLKAGYAVVSTDYEGLGTPGVHPFLIGSSEARSTLDIVRAARQFDPHLSANVVIAGHSQGGQAALFSAALAPSWTPELHIHATVAFAPVNHIVALQQFYEQTTAPPPLDSVLLALGIPVLADLDPAQFSPSKSLSPAAQALYPQLFSQCLLQLSAANSLGGIPPSAVYEPGFSTPATDAALTRLVDPEQLTIKTPVLIEQGLSDNLVEPALTAELAHEYAAKRTPVTFHTFPGVGHIDLVTSPAGADATSWIESHLPP